MGRKEDRLNLFSYYFFGSCAIATALTVIVTLGVRWPGFTATYSAQAYPELVYAFNRSSNTATCTAYRRSEATTYACSSSTLTFSLLELSSSYYARSTYSAVTRSTVTTTAYRTVTATATPSGVSSASSSHSLITMSGATPTASLARRQAASVLSGSVISTLPAPPPTQTSIPVHLPRLEKGYTIFFLLWTSIGLFVALATLSFGTYNLLSQRRLLADRQQENVYGSECEKAATFQSAWNMLPSGSTYFLMAVLPLIFLSGIVVNVLMGLHLKGLQTFIDNGACGGYKDSQYWDWQYIFCGESIVGRPFQFAPASSNRPVNLTNYGWTLTVPLGMLCATWVSLMGLFVTICRKMELAKGHGVEPAPRYSRSRGGGGYSGGFGWVGGGFAGWGGGDGGGDGGGGGGC